MRLRNLWIGGLLGLCVLSGAALADVRVSTSNHTSAGITTTLRDLPGQERLALGTTPAAHPGFGAGLSDRMIRALHPVVPRRIAYTEAYLAALPTADGDAEWECLAQAVYFEARGETVKGQFAVAEVILNRVKSPLYPNTICRVVHQGGSGGCQFSFTCDGASDRIRERAAYRVAGKIARLMLDGAPRVLTDGATHFHTRNVRPGWAHRMPRTASIGQHMFYRVASGG